MRPRLIFLLCVLFICGCTANFYVSRDEFITQVAESQIKTERTAVLPIVAPAAVAFFAVKYDANNIQKILCRDKNGELVYLYPDQNTQIEITTKSTNDVVKMYFGTVFFEGNKLVGKRSRLLGVGREVELADIDKIVLYAEFPKVEKAQLK